MCSSGGKNLDSASHGGEEARTIEGFSRGDPTYEHDVDAAEVEDELVVDEEEKSEEPEDGESLDERMEE